MTGGVCAGAGNRQGRTDADYAMTLRLNAESSRVPKMDRNSGRMFPNIRSTSTDRSDDQNVASIGYGRRESLKEASALLIHKYIHMLPNDATLVHHAIDDSREP